MHLAVQVINALQDGTGAQDPAFNANSAKLKTRREREREDLHCTSGRFKSYRSGRSRIILRARSVSMTFFLSGNSSCISFAVVRSTLLLLDFSSEYFVLS